MPIGVTDEHEELRRQARRFMDAACPREVPRASLDGGNRGTPPFWDQLRDQAWLGLHLAEEYGGQGYGMAELAVVVEEMGRAVAPGPFVATVLTSALIQRWGSGAQRAAWLPGLSDGTVVGSTAFSGGALEGVRSARGLALDGCLEAVQLVIGTALVLAPVMIDSVEHWLVVDSERLGVEQLPSLDETRPLARVTADRIDVDENAVLANLDRAHVLATAAVIIAAEAAGGAGWCLDTAVAHAKVREQFGRPIGQFQAVKHRCADMMVAVEQASALAWDAARAYDEGDDDYCLSAATAASMAPASFTRCAKDVIQVLGGIGFTWEHDAHLYLKRAVTNQQLLGGPVAWRRRTLALALDGRRRALGIDLPTEAESFRAEVRAFLAQLSAEPERARLERIVDAGYSMPHWPQPWGRAANAVEQLVIDEEFERAGVARPHPGIGSFALPAIFTYGSPEQQERWMRPSLLGEIAWCQMFSEPGAGSDLASLSTKASRAPGGWLLSGQKVWTTMARDADWAICLARTSSSKPKHLGITYFLVDMKSEGLDIRPLRELTGDSLFNEIFLTDVFVPDDCVLGEIDDGWKIARTTLANERVVMSRGSAFGGGLEALLSLLKERGLDPDRCPPEAIGELIAEAQSVALLGFRTTVRAISGAALGPESSLRKLLGVEHDQRVQEAALAVLGPSGAITSGDDALWVRGFLGSRCLTIAGGTSEIQRNVISERLLGMPRDP